MGAVNTQHDRRFRICLALRSASRVPVWSKPIGISIIAISGLRSRISGKLWRYSTEVFPLQSHATIQPLLQPSIPARIIHEFYYARSAVLRAGLRRKVLSQIFLSFPSADALGSISPPCGLQPRAGSPGLPEHSTLFSFALDSLSKIA